MGTKHCSYCYSSNDILVLLIEFRLFALLTDCIGIEAGVMMLISLTVIIGLWMIKKSGVVLDFEQRYKAGGIHPVRQITSTAGFLACLMILMHQ